MSCVKLFLLTPRDSSLTPEVLFIQNRVLGKGCVEAIGKEREASPRKSRKQQISESCFLPPGEVIQESAALSLILHLVTVPFQCKQGISIVGLDMN